MKIIKESEYNQIIAQLGRHDSPQAQTGITRDSWLADSLMTVEITQDWAQSENDAAWTAQVKRVVFDDGNYTLEGDEFPIYYPGSKDNEKPSQAVGDRVSVAYRGRWEVIGGGGAGGMTVIAKLQADLVTKSSATAKVLSIPSGDVTSEEITVYAVGWKKNAKVEEKTNVVASQISGYWVFIGEFCRDPSTEDDEADE